MKNYCLCLVVYSLCSFTTVAQEPIGLHQQTSSKPLLFSRIANRTTCDAGILLKAFKGQVQDTITLQLSPEYSFTGVLTEKVQHSPELLSINLRSVTNPGALFHLSLLTPTHTTRRITGRIIHPQSGDVLQLIQEQGNYILVKQSQKLFLAE